MALNQNLLAGLLGTAHASNVAATTATEPMEEAAAQGNEDPPLEPFQVSQEPLLTKQPRVKTGCATTTAWAYASMGRRVSSSARTDTSMDTDYRKIL
jgi:hypothetical protein